MTQTSWAQKGESLSLRNACKEYGLEEAEIIEAMKAGKLQYIVNYAHGNPYYKLLRKEVVALVIALRGHDFFEKKEIEFKMKSLKREINSCKRKISANERELRSLAERLKDFDNE